MRLYHFTSPLHVEGCCKEGIAKGSIPLVVKGKIGLAQNWQWLTSNPEFHQEWANTEYSTLPYDRTAFRLTVNIPKAHSCRLFKWTELCKSLSIIEGFNDYGDPENWWVFAGRIRPGWIREVEAKEGEKDGKVS